VQQLGYLKDRLGLVEPRRRPERRRDRHVQAAAPTGRVGEVDDRVPGPIETRDGGPDGDGLPRP
jgi:hypothetical protein